jgi:glyoxylase-like metal-dependent hydrolase (beta-lactamase superfamily II)
VLEVVEHGPVREIRMASLAGRVVGYKVSAFVHDGVLIDTGFPRARRQLGAYLAANPVRGAIVTHWHEDHSGNLGMLLESDVPVTVQAETLALLPRTERLPRYRRLVWGHAPPAPVPTTPATHRFELIPTPGHSPDHVAVWDPVDGVVFLGDLFLGLRACAMHRGEDPYALLASLERVVALQPEQAFCAHRGRLRDPVAALTARAHWIDGAIRKVERLVDEEWGDRAITYQVLGGERLLPFISNGELAKRHFVDGVRAELRRVSIPDGSVEDPGPP